MATFETLAQWILNLVNWGVTILVFMLIWEIIQFARGSGERQAAGEPGWFGKAKGWFGQREKTKKVKRAAGREKTRLLSEYIEEKEELEKLDDAQKAFDAFKAEVNSAAGAGITKRKEFVDRFAELQKAVNEAGKEVSKLKRVTWRQQRRSKQLLDELDKSGAEDAELKKLRAVENDILKKHDELIKHLTTAAQPLADNGAIGKEVAPIKRAKAGSIPLATKIGGKETRQRIADINSALGSVKDLLEKARKAQEEAYKLTEGLIAAFRSLWGK